MSEENEVIVEEVPRYSGKLHAVFFNAEGQKRISYDGEDRDPGSVVLTEAEQIEVDSVVQPAPDALTAEQVRDAAKVERAVAVNAITVKVGNKVFDGDERSQERMARAILGMQIAGANSIVWTLADNTVVPVTLDELGQALVLSGAQQAALWPI